MINLCMSTSFGLLQFEAVAGYVGPGAGLTMLSALLAVVLVLLLALLAPFLYAVRMVRGMLGRWRTKRMARLDGRVVKEVVAHANGECTHCS